MTILCSLIIDLSILQTRFSDFGDFRCGGVEGGDDCYTVTQTPRTISAKQPSCLVFASTVVMSDHLSVSKSTSGLCPLELRISGENSKSVGVAAFLGMDGLS